jgi:molecular chaperone DnaJ
MADYYELIGVSSTASAEEIKRAYRKRARELHPDANPGDAQSEEQFKLLAQAYEVLSDPDTRARYDRFGEAGVSGGGSNANDIFGGAGGFGDLIDAFFGGGGSPFGSRAPSGPPRGQDVELVADLTFEQAVFGASVPITVRTAVACSDCGGSGAGQGTKPVTCSDCGGSGQTRRVRQSMLGQMVTAGACQRCGGTGQVIATPCPTCRGDGRVMDTRTLQVDVPGGVDTGATLRLTGRGAAGPRGGPNGDLYVHIRVGSDPRFARDGDDIVTELPVSIAQAALGLTTTIETLDGPLEVHVAPGSQPGKQLVVRGPGVTRLNGRGGRGDLRVIVNVQVPMKLSEAETEMLRRYAAERGEQIDPPEKGLFSKIKSAFT